MEEKRALEESEKWQRKEGAMERERMRKEGLCVCVCDLLVVLYKK